MKKYYLTTLIALSVLIGPDGSLGIASAAAQVAAPPRNSADAPAQQSPGAKPSSDGKPSSDAKPSQDAKPQTQQMPDAPAEPQQRSRSRSRRRLDPGSLRTAPTMRELFHDVLETPSQSVVEVFADGKRVCLGTVVSANGHIATKASLVKGEVTCRLPHVKEPVSAELIGANNDYDLAILKVDRNDLSPIQWSLKKYDLGSFVASPNIDGDAHAIGVMSVQRRRFSVRQPRSSAAGQERGFLGVMTVPAGGENQQGVRLQQVVANSGAASAGLKRNDLLMKINDQVLKQPQELFDLLRTLKPKDEVNVEIQRGEEMLKLTVILGKPPGNTRSPMDRWGGGPFSERRFNFPEVLAHDSVVAPNNIGGPLVDSYGNVIGLNVSRALRVTTYAIAANDMQRLIKEISGLSTDSPSVASVKSAPVPKPARETIRAAGIDGTVLLSGKGAASNNVLASFVGLAGGADAELVILQSGQGNEDDSLRLIEELQKAKGASVSLVRTDDPSAEQLKRITSLLSTATAVWVDAASGESIERLMKETAVTDAIRAVLKRDGVVGGSAGFSVSIGGQAIKTSTSEFSLIPQSIVTTSESEDRLPSGSGLFSIQLADGAAIVCRGRRLTSVGEAPASIQFAATPTYPKQQTVSLTGRSRTADLTSLRRLAVHRTMPVFPAAKPAAPEVASGTLMIVGGGGMPRGGLSRFVKAAGGKEAKIVVIPISTPDPLPEQDGMARALRRVGAGQVTVLRGRTPEAANDEKSLEALREATGVWFGGGRQWRFVDAYEGTEAYDLFHDVLKRGGIVGGSSAGASIQGEFLARGNPLSSRTMMAPGYERGFNFLPGVAIDQHFTQRNRFSDLKRLVTRYPQLLGIGLDESTAIVVKENVAEVIGRTRVCFYDGGSDEEDFTSVDAGQRYDLVERKILSEADED
ncbi:MAG: cyanophycinase [Fuerstiella sp.]